MMIEKKLSLSWLRDLKSDAILTVGVRAASGLLKVDKNFFVVADDELSLFQFRLEGGMGLISYPLLAGELPIDPKERKRQKPDWESLVRLKIGSDRDIILAVPSGSTNNRMIGVAIELNQDGLIDQSRKISKVDFSEIFSSFTQKISDLNIEGACVFKNKLKLFQRGNGSNGINAVVDISLEGFCSDLKQNRPISSKNILGIETYQLGDLGGYKLGFTDACALNDSIWFLAATEDSNSTYDDGQYHGAILACLDSEGKVVERYQIDCPSKPEGLWVEEDQNGLNFYVVTDADSSTQFASVFLGQKI